MNEFYALVGRKYPEFDTAARRSAATLIELALAEDVGTPLPCLELDAPSGRVVLRESLPATSTGDVTSESTIPANARGSGVFVARDDGVVAGMPVLAMVAIRFGLATWFRPRVADGERVVAGDVIAEIHGPMRSLLLMERTALNFIQRLCGIATLTARYVQAVEGTRARILDTRKTCPGWRSLEKYAVRRGGGANHRMGLWDQVLIKDNHLAWIDRVGEPDSVGRAVAEARTHAPAGMIVEVEVDSLEQLDRALAARPDIILVDNLGADSLAEAVRRRDDRAPGVLLEASGGVRLETVAALARTGVDRISVGALTHSAPAFDIGLDFDRSGPE